MQRINTFFFSLLVLHNVEDPVSGHVFNILAACKLRVLVEIPDKREARHVAKYLQAFEDGTIDSLYGSNEMGYHFLFCLDDS